MDLKTNKEISEELKNINSEIKKIRKKLNKRDNELDGLVNEKRARKMLQKGSTWFWEARTKKGLKFKRAGRSIFYDKQDLVDFIENNG